MKNNTKKFLILFILLFSLQQSYSCVAANTLGKALFRNNLIRGNNQNLNFIRAELARDIERAQRRENLDNIREEALNKLLRRDQKIYTFVGLSFVLAFSSLAAYNWLYRYTE